VNKALSTSRGTKFHYKDYRIGQEERQVKRPTSDRRRDVLGPVVEVGRWYPGHSSQRGPGGGKRGVLGAYGVTSQAMPRSTAFAQAADSKVVTLHANILVESNLDNPDRPSPGGAPDGKQVEDGADGGAGSFACCDKRTPQIDVGKTMVGAEGSSAVCPADISKSNWKKARISAVFRGRGPAIKAC